jgi:kynureninase
MTREQAVARDAADPLQRRDLFDLPDGVVYLDGNSLGALPRSVPDRMSRALRDEWGNGLIASWNTADWVGLSRRVGARIAPLIGARPDDVHVGDSTSVTLFKTLVAATRLRPGRRVVVMEPTTFPTDGYVAAGVARAFDLEIRWSDPADPAAALDDDVALLAVTHVDFRSGAMYDLPALTRAAHDAGALAQWDLCHSTGAVPVDLTAADADVAVGCTYKYLNGGPGAPAFVYARADLLPRLRQPIQGWMGAAEPFVMGERYEPDPGIRRFLSGTPSILAMQPLADMLALLDELGVEAVRAKSERMTAYAIDRFDDELAPLGVRLASPRDPARRGSHVTFDHPAFEAVLPALHARGVVPDFRRPDGLRIGLSPLSTSFAELELGIQAIRDELVRRR